MNSDEYILVRMSGENRTGHVTGVSCDICHWYNEASTATEAYMLYMRHDCPEQ